MSTTYTKLFSSITESTIWSENNSTRLTWITMLAMADKNGRIWASIPGLAWRARVSTEEAEEALECFLKPDKHSRTKDYDGCRIMEIDGGWLLLNHEKYRALRDDIDMKDRKSKWARENRKSRAKVDTKVDTGRQKVDKVDDVDEGSHNAEAEAAPAPASEADFDAKQKSNTTPTSSAPSKTSFDVWWGVVHRKVGKEAAKQAYAKAVKRITKEGNPNPNEYLLDRMRAFADSPEATPMDHSPIHPATWLNGGRYDDDPETWKQKVQTRRLSPQAQREAETAANIKIHMERKNGERTADYGNGNIVDGKLVEASDKSDNRNILQGPG